MNFSLLHQPFHPMTHDLDDDHEETNTLESEKGGSNARLIEEIGRSTQNTRRIRKRVNE
jgi:hypothetical protein